MTDRALVDGVETAWVDCIIESALQAIRPHAAVETIQIFGVIALDWAGKEICLVAIADPPARDDRERWQLIAVTEGVDLAGRVAELSAGDISGVIVIPSPVPADCAPAPRPAFGRP